MILGIGSGKCGTSTIYDWICQSPQIDSGTGTKEHHYFDRDRNSISTEQYLSNVGQIDITPKYLITKDAPQEAFRMFPDAKVFCIVRNPTERAWSSYCMMIERHMTGERYFPQINYSFSQLFQLKHSSSLMEMGLYWKHISRWSEFFDVKVFDFNHIFFDDGFNDVVDWLGLDKYPLNRTHIMKSMSVEMPAKYREKLDRFYEKPNQELYQNTGIKWGT